MSKRRPPKGYDQQLLPFESEPFESESTEAIRRLEAMYQEVKTIESWDRVTVCRHLAGGYRLDWCRIRWTSKWRPEDSWICTECLERHKQGHHIELTLLDRTCADEMRQQSASRN